MSRLIGHVEPSGSLPELQASPELHFVKTHELHPSMMATPRFRFYGAVGTPWFLMLISCEPTNLIAIQSYRFHQNLQMLITEQGSVWRLASARPGVGASVRLRR